MDTRNKRASAIGVAFVAALILPAPDATVGQPDRQHAAYSYAGIQAITGETSPSVPTARQWRVPLRGSTWHAPERMTDWRIPKRSTEWET